MEDARKNAAYGQAALNGNNIKSNFSILHNELGAGTEKLCLFASYNFTEEIAAYVIYYLSELKKEGFTIAFITTSALQATSIEKLKPFCSLIVERENKGLDFASWKLGLEICNWGNDYREVLIANDSVFGPFHSLGATISTMNRRFDVWGMTDNYEMDYHLQSYFIYFNETVVKSQAWMEFWQGMNFKGLSKIEIIRKYEVGLSQTFIGAGFKLGVYTSIDTLNRSEGSTEKEISPSIVHWKPLIEKFSFPFLKRELLIKPAINRTYWHKKIYVNTGGWHRLIEQQTSYPVALIDDFLQDYFQHAALEEPKLKLKKKKILFITHNAEAGDAQKELLYFLHWLAINTAIPFEVIVATSSDNNSLYDDFANLCPTTQFWMLQEREQNEFKDRLISESIGLVFSNALANVELQQFLSFLNAPQVLYVDELPYEGSRMAVIEKHKDWFKRNTSHFIADADTLQEKLRQYFKLEPNALSLVHKFIDDWSQPDGAEAVHAMAHEIDIPYNSFVIGVYGMFDGQRSADLILSAAAMLCKSKSDIHFVWTEAAANSSLYKSLETDFKRAGISGQMHLIPKQKNSERYYTLFNVFLMLSNDDTLPLVNLEVGLRGVPVICFESSATATDYIKHGSGRAVPFLDIAAIRDAVLDYYNDKERLKNNAPFISKVVRNNFLLPVQAPKLFEVLNTYYAEKEEVPVDEHPAITIMVHLFYDNTWKELKQRLVFFKDLNVNFLFSVSEACLIKEELVEDIRASFKNAYILTTSNIGKDIGGKFALIDLYLSLGLQSDYIIFLHDKQSPHSLDGNTWKNNLMKVIDYRNYKNILATFAQDEKIGIVGAREHLVNEYDPANGTFINNNDRTHFFLKRYGISISNYEFIGGTMYWMKAPIIENFFTKFNPMQIRSELEAGNVMDNYGSTNAHTWERILSWAATNQGYRVCGI